MISKNKQKMIRSLALKKKRDELNLFVAEGHKSVNDLLRASINCISLIATPEYRKIESSHTIKEYIEVTNEELKQTSLLKTPQQVIGIFEKPQTNTPYPQNVISSSLCLALDCIQDSGNLGTIIRLADWFGIKNIFCSEDTADAYSPKTIQATMGSIARVNIEYLPLKKLISQLSHDTPIYGTFLEGENIYQTPLKQNGLIVMGNEGNGISKEIEKLVNQKLLIPKFSLGINEGAESLNVAMATAITLSEFKRRIP